MKTISLVFLMIFYSGCASQSKSKKKITPEIVDHIERETMAFIKKNQLKDILLSSNHYNAISGLCHLKEFSKAFSLLDEIHSKSSHNPYYWNQVGLCYLLQKMFLKAELYFNKAVEINAHFAPTLNNLGILYLKQNDDQKAAMAFKKAIKANYKLTIPKLNLAYLYLKYNFYKKAQLLFLELNKKNPNNISILKGLAISFLYIGNYQKAYDFFAFIKDKNKERADIGLNNVMAAYFLDKKIEAQKIFSQIDKNSLGPWKEIYLRIKEFLKS